MEQITQQKEITLKVSATGWLRIVAVIAALVGISFGLTYVFQNVAERLNLPLYEYASLAYLSVFLSMLISNLTIVAPVPIGLSIMIAAASRWDPVLVAISAAVGASIGELSGYYAGYFGRRIAIPDSMLCSISRTLCKNKIEQWMQRRGAWAVFALAFQPVLPFDIAGLIAGAARMPLRKFLLALLGGKFLKYIIIVYTAAGVISHIPFLSPPPA